MVINPAWDQWVSAATTGDIFSGALIATSPGEYFSGEILRCKRCKNEVCFDSPGRDREEYRKRGSRCSSCYRQWLNGKIMKARGR